MDEMLISIASKKFPSDLGNATSYGSQEQVPHKSDYGSLVG